jgi:hypothetical protein
MDHVPTERLELTSSAPGFNRLGRQWSDTAKRTLTERLGEVVLVPTAQLRPRGYQA